MPEIPEGNIPEGGIAPETTLNSEANLLEGEATAAASRDESARAGDEQAKQQKASRYRGFFKSTDPSGAPRASEAPATPEASEPEGILSNDGEPTGGSNDRGFILVGDTGPQEMVVSGPQEMIVSGPDSSFDPDETIVIEESDPASSTGPTSEFVVGEPVPNGRASDKAPDSGPIEVDGQFDELDPNREARIRDTVSTSVNGARESGGEVSAKDIVDNEYKIEAEEIRAKVARDNRTSQEGIARDDRTSKEGISRDERSSREGISRDDRTSKESISRDDRASREGISRDDRTSREGIARNDRASRKAIARDDRASREGISRDDRTSREGIARDDRSSREGISRDDRTSREGISRDDRSSREGIAKNDRASREGISRDDRASKEGISRDDRSSREGIARDDRSSREGIARDDRASKEGISRDDRTSREGIARDDRAMQEKIAKADNLTKINVANINKGSASDVANINKVSAKEVADLNNQTKVDVSYIQGEYDIENTNLKGEYDIKVQKEIINYKQDLMNKMFMPMIVAQLVTASLGAVGNTKTQQAGMDREVSMALLRSLG